MRKLASQAGNTIVYVTFGLFALALIAALGFGAWSFTERTKYKTTSDAITAEAVKENTKKIQAEDATKYAEAAKLPYKTWLGPAAFGSVEITYPKTWSFYSDGVGKSATPVNIFAHPDVVPTTDDPGSSFALRVQVVPSAYSSVLAQFTGFQRSGKSVVVPYSLPKNPSDVGVKVTGQIAPKKLGTMIVLPLRDKTLKIWTESPAAQPDFDNVILPNVHFSP